MRIETQYLQSIDMERKNGHWGGHELIVNNISYGFYPNKKLLNKTIKELKNE